MASLGRPDLAAVSGGGRIQRAGSLRGDVGAHIVTLGDEEIQPTQTEFRPLRTLMERRGSTRSRRRHRAVRTMLPSP